MRASLPFLLLAFAATSSSSWCAAAADADDDGNVALSDDQHLAACPADESIVSLGGGSKVDNFIFESRANVDLEVFWINTRGVGSSIGYLEANSQLTIGTYIGHAFRIYQGEDDSSKVLVAQITVGENDDARAVIYPCKGMKARFDVDAEKYELLVHDQDAPCEPSGMSSKWSCIRYTDAKAYKLRDPDLYGFKDKKEAGRRSAGDTLDNSYTDHIPHIPRFTKGPGFLKMSFTPKLKSLLLPFYKEKKATSMIDHGRVPGGYLNDVAVSMDKINLDDYRSVQRGVWREMKGVLEWWSQRSLRHTSTFGIRVYRRGSMLINHVDRADTHMLSAVIQVAQDCDDDGGWPLEILDKNGNAYEVFLQPGEMVLYEGAVFRHGRPMRFRGNEFANIFTHFAPPDWHGPHKSPAYNHLTQASLERRQREDL